MFAQVTSLRYWKSEHNKNTCEDACNASISEGLFAVADGAGTTIFADIWAKHLIKRFFDVPLMSKEPFEVEWWVRQAQTSFLPLLPKAEDMAWNAQQKAQNQGSQSTLATLRISQSTSSSAQGELLVFGDSCIFLGRPSNKKIILSFPLNNPADFARPPICVPSKQSIFNRYMHKCDVASMPIEPDDIVILATDAVSKWILSGGGGRFQNDIWASFLMVAQQTEQNWPEFIEGCREKQEMIDDDSTALVINFMANGHPGTELGKTYEHNKEVREARKKAFELADSDKNSELIAIIYGDGKDLKAEGIHLQEDQIEKAQKVADALKTLLSVIREELNSPNFIVKVQPLWYQYADILRNEKCAENVRQTLQLKGVQLAQSPGPLSQLSVQQSSSSPGQQPGVVRSPEDEEKRIVALMRRFMTAYRDDDDLAMVEVANQVPQSKFDEVFTPEVQERIKLARQRSTALRTLRGALAGHNAETIVNADKLVDIQTKTKYLTEDETRKLDLAARFIRACRNNDDEGLLVIETELLQPSYYGLIRLTLEESQRIAVARQRKEALKRFQVALESGRAELIVTEYDSILDKAQNISPEQRQRLDLARRFVEAYRKDDDQAIALTYNEILKSDRLKNFVFTPEEEKRVVLAQRLKKFRDALATRNLREIANAFQLIHGDFDKLSEAEERKLLLARQFVAAYDANDNQQILQAYNAIHTSPYYGSLNLTTEEEERVSHAMQSLYQHTASTVQSALTLSANQSSKVYHVKALYWPLNYPAYPRTPQELEQSAAEDISNDPYIQEGIQEVNNSTSKVKIADPLTVLHVVFESFKNNTGGAYHRLLTEYQLSEQDIKDILLIFLRQEHFREYLSNQKSQTLESWLEMRKKGETGKASEQGDESDISTVKTTIITSWVKKFGKKS